MAKLNHTKFVTMVLIAIVTLIASFVGLTEALHLISSPRTIEVYLGLGLLLAIAVSIYTITIKIYKHAKQIF